MTAMDMLGPLVRRRCLRREPQLREKRAQQDERATVGCFLEAHDMTAEPCIKTQQPVVECRVAQSESE
eukprot:4365515-Pleurochrysis_carterae.AAC.1